MRIAPLLIVTACATQEKPPPKIEMVAMDPLPPASAAPTASTAAVIDAGVDPHRKELVVGKIITLPADGVRNFSVAAGNIDVALTPDGKTFVISGKKAGRVDLLLIKKNGAQETFTFDVYDQ